MSEASSTIEEIALELGRCAHSWEPGARLLGNVRAAEIVRLCCWVLGPCPDCDDGLRGEHTAEEHL